MNVGKEKSKAVSAKIPRQSTTRTNTISNKNKINYMTKNMHISSNYNQRLAKRCEINSVNYRYEANKLQSVNGDESDSVRLEVEKYESIDHISQNSVINIDSKTDSNFSIFRTRKGSLTRGKSDTSTITKTNEILDLSDQSLLEVPIEL